VLHPLVGLEHSEERGNAMEAGDWVLFLGPERMPFSPPSLVRITSVFRRGYDGRMVAEFDNPPLGVAQYPVERFREE
jgi:hypothetical protein